jgi:hypothetical protein
MTQHAPWFISVPIVGLLWALAIACVVELWRGMRR